MRPAISGELALHSAIGNPPELVLLDICILEMDGFEVCRQLKAHPITCNVPVSCFAAFITYRGLSQNPIVFSRACVFCNS